MLDKMFEELINKGLFTETREILVLGNACNTIYKAVNKEVKQVLKRELTKQGMNVNYDRYNRVYIIEYKGYFAGCYC